jgi:hypothetical protein
MIALSNGTLAHYGDLEMSAYESIKRGLTEAIAFTEGREISARVHQVEVPAVYVDVIRASCGLSQVRSRAAKRRPGR